MAKNAKTGIATSVFKGHHTRAASTSAAAVCKVPFISTFMDNEDWSNDITFGKFYKKSIVPANKAMDSSCWKTSTHRIGTDIFTVHQY